jgi:hypothetical protein
LRAPVNAASTVEQLAALGAAFRRVQEAVAGINVGGTLGGDLDAIRSHADAGLKTVTATLRQLPEEEELERQALVRELGASRDVPFTAAQLAGKHIGELRTLRAEGAETKRRREAEARASKRADLSYGTMENSYGKAPAG